MSRKLRVVIIDDNAADAGVVKRALKRNPEIDPDIAHFTDGESGSKAVLAGEFDCLILDYRLGQESGLEVLSEIRRQGLDTAVVTCTGQGDEMIAVEAMRRGAQDYLSKAAINSSSLGRAVHNAVDKVALERALADRRRELEDFVSVVAHDLQQPLCAVSGNLDLLRDYYQDNLDEKGREFLQAARRTADRMSQMIDGLLAYARFGRSVEKAERIELTEIIDLVRANLQEAIREAGAVIEHDELPAVSGSRMAILHLLQNLTANAVKYRGAKPPRIRISAAQEEDDCWRIDISDNGIGIDPKDHERIFGPFQRAHPRGYSGSGIGLATCKKIVEQHGGRIWVESEPGRGSTFSFTLAGAASIEPEVAKQLGGILLVDDEPEILRFLGEALRRRGYGVTACERWSQGARAMAERDFSLVITDLVVPDEGGLKYIEKIRSQQPNLPIIAISGGGRDAPGPLLHRAKKLGADRVFPKPFDTQELLRAVQELAA